MASVWVSRHEVVVTAPQSSNRFGSTGVMFWQAAGTVRRDSVLTAHLLLQPG